MGFFNRKSESVAIGDLSPEEALRAIRSGKVPGYSAKDLRKMEKDLVRKTQGEKGIGAIGSALRGGGTGNKNHQNIPLKDRVHPAEYRRILEREAKRQGLL